MEQIKIILLGSWDSIYGITAVRYLRESELKSKQSRKANGLRRIFECCLLNGGVFWLSILAFDFILLPLLYTLMQLLLSSSPDLLTSVWYWLQPLLSYTFGALWVLPLFLLSRIVNALWFQDIADSATSKSRSKSFGSFSKLIADTFFSLVIQALFMIQSLFVGLLPINYVGQFFSIFHLSLLYSLYSFEYKWFNLGCELHTRLHLIQNNWPYFFGFGLPLAILTSIPNSYVISGCIFSIMFPLFIVSANEAKPTRSDFTLALQIFQPSIWMANKLHLISAPQEINRSTIQSNAHRDSENLEVVKRREVNAQTEQSLYKPSTIPSTGVLPIYKTSVSNTPSVTNMSKTATLQMAFDAKDNPYHILTSGADLPSSTRESTLQSSEQMVEANEYEANKFDYKFRGEPTENNSSSLKIKLVK